MTNRERYKYVKEKLKNDPFELDEDGREIIDITISNHENILSPYSPDNKEIIDSSIADIINNSIKGTNYKKDVHLRITCNKYPPEKENLYKNAIINYYVNEFSDKERKLKNNLTIALITFILTIIGFIALVIVNNLDLYWAIIEFVDIVAWVFGWETVDLIFFQRQLIKNEQRIDLKIIFATITFQSNKKTL